MLNDNRICIRNNQKIENEIRFRKVLNRISEVESEISEKKETSIKNSKKCLV